MKDEFITINNTVINKTAFLRRLNELEKEIKSLESLSELIPSTTEIEKQKLEFAIEQLKEMDTKMKSVSDTSRDVLINKIEQLQQQLNQL